MTDEERLAEIRDLAKCDEGTEWMAGDVFFLLRLLDAKDREIVELRAQVEDHLIVAHGLNERLDAAEAERDAALAQVARLAERRPRRPR